MSFGDRVDLVVDISTIEDKHALTTSSKFALGIQFYLDESLYITSFIGTAYTTKTKKAVVAIVSVLSIQLLLKISRN